MKQYLKRITEIKTVIESKRNADRDVVTEMKKHDLRKEDRELWTTNIINTKVNRQHETAFTARNKHYNYNEKYETKNEESFDVETEVKLKTSNLQQQ